MFSIGGRLDFISVQTCDGVSTLRLSRGKVNALNQAVVDQLRKVLKDYESDPEITAIILTGTGSFFSFGFDVPEFFSASKKQFIEYLMSFTDLYKYIFQYPKPVIAALNGHTIAGGCMLALACDYRVMVTGKAKISLNEISFGASVPAGSAEMLRFWVGNANATEVLFSGAMYSAEEGMRLGLVQRVATKEELIAVTRRVAADFASKYSPAFISIKSLLRKRVAEEMANRERESIREFVDIWYSKATLKKLENIRIHDS
jgi:3,2-trans-enoyl-CoA isomerase